MFWMPENITRFRLPTIAKGEDESVLFHFHFKSEINVGWIKDAQRRTGAGTKVLRIHQRTVDTAYGLYPPYKITAVLIWNWNDTSTSSDFTC